jgi:large subunit ribosomal protein L4
MKAQVFKHDGGKASEITISEKLFGQKWNSDLVHEVVVVMEGNARAGTADTKDRGEVRGGGKKPWKQKGTGRARHGSRRSPIWTGGGIAHGPLSAKDYSRKLNKKVRAKALAVTLSKKYADGEVVFVEALSFSAPKASEAKAVIKSLAEVSGEKSLTTKRKNTAVIVLPGRDEATEKSFRNFGNFEVVMAKDVNPVNLLTYKYVIVTDPKASLETLEKRVTN